jgi:hypothetical protein
MKDAVGKIVPKGGERAMDVRGLAAPVAMRPDQRRPAIEAGIAAVPLPLARPGLDGARGEASGHGFSDAFEAPCHHPPFMTEARARVETL